MTAFTDLSEITPLADLRDSVIEPAPFGAFTGGQVAAGDPVATRLRAIAGAGNPYVFIVARTDGTDVEIGGIYPDDLPGVLQELIDHLVSE